MSIGKFCASLGTVQNENTLALINLNFDFALCRFDAPKEFLGLGASLSDKRRAAAESGVQHRIARKLGALFEQHAPSAPELISAFGQRVSEISQVKGVNTKGRGKDGPFADQMGIDGTAIWAAATSGPSAIPVLMLACMLARIWKAPEATSLWAEIISQRQEEIRRTCDGSKASDYATLQAMQQEFPRSQLADWDASIRAWLRTADEAKISDQRQLMLIVNNINLPVSNNMSVYKSVLDTWGLAMASMNNLIKGVPQRVQNGALLLGLSAWHLYPDMIVHGAVTKEVKFEDILVGAGGIITIGLQNDENHDEGVYWSLPLAYLRYYGDPVQSSRSISKDSSRVSMDQLAQVALGAIFSSWEEPSSQILNLATWFSALFDSLGRVASRTSKFYSQSPNSRDMARSLLKSPSWMEMLTNAANALIASNGTERETSMRLVAFGMRRCSQFLAKASSHPPPFFGLSNPGYLLPMLVNEDERITLLRKVAQNLDLDKSCLIIRYRCVDEDENLGYEYASVTPYIPSPRKGRKRNNRGKQVAEFLHKRWVAMQLTDETLTRRFGDDSENSCDCIDICLGPTDFSIGCPCSAHHSGCTKECSCFDLWDTKLVDGRKPSLSEELAEEKEEPKCYINESLMTRFEGAVRRRAQGKTEVYSLQTLDDYTEKIDSYRDEFKVETAPYMEINFNREVFLNTWNREQPRHGPTTIALEDAPWDEEQNGRVSTGQVEFLFGDETAAILRFRPDLRVIPVTSTNCFYLDDLTEVFSRDAVDVSRFGHYLQHTVHEKLSMDYAQSLKALASAADIYKLLPNATIDLSVTNRPLHETRWVSSMGKSVETETFSFSNKLTRPLTFACIANFESGSFDIEPKHLEAVMAMSSGNSIFVAAPLLCDPSEDPVEHEIRRVIGNIGRAGIAMLIPPQDTKIRKLEPETWNLINHVPYDGKLEDSFKSTSLHMSFTPYTQPINISDHGLQDSEVYFLESLVSVHDREKWVADIDVLKTFKSSLFCRHQNLDGCSHVPGSFNDIEENDFVCLDNWEELLDKGDASGILRAKDNWLARLAAAAISVKQGHKTIVLPDQVCWECVQSVCDFPRGVTYVY